ncbi:MAG: hypothetical protein ACYTG0_19655 [Planctomycetota bacterium]|jgi:hypothetical protein
MKTQTACCVMAALLMDLSGTTFAVGDGVAGTAVNGAGDTHQEEEGSAAAVEISLEGAYFYKGQFPALKISTTEWSSGRAQK